MSSDCRAVVREGRRSADVTRDHVAPPSFSRTLFLAALFGGATVTAAERKHVPNGTCPVCGWRTDERGLRYEVLNAQARTVETRTARTGVFCDDCGTFFGVR